MRRKTYAYNGITIGVLIALLVYFTTENIILTVIAGIGVAVLGFLLIRLIEKAVYKGVDKAADKISDAYQRRREQKQNNK